MSPEQSRTVYQYHPTLFFRGAAAFMLVSSVYLATEVWRTGDFFVILFFVVVLFAAVAMSAGSLATATWDGETFIYQLPLRPEHRLSREQIIDIEVVGRRTRALLIHYHPRNENGFIDRQREVFLNLTPLEDQLDLMERLLGQEDDDPAGD